MTANSLVAWTNLTKNAAITAVSTATNFSPTNVANDSGSASVGWQSVFGVKTTAGGAVLTIKPATTGQMWDVIAVFRTNLTANAVVTFTLLTNPSTTVWTATASPTAGYGQVIALPPASTVADYATISFDDSANPDGYINVPLVFCGAGWRPLGSCSFQSTVGRDYTIGEATSRGGQEYPTFYYQRRRWNIQFDSLRASETWTYADPLSAYAAGGSNVLFIPDVTSSYVQQEALFGRLKPTADISYPYAGADRRRWSAQLTERL